MPINNVITRTAQNPEGTEAPVSATAATAAAEATPSAPGRGITAGSRDRVSRTADPEAMRAILQQSGLNLDLSATSQRYIESLPAEARAGLASFASALSGTTAGGPGGVVNISGGDLQSRWAEHVSKVALHGNVDVNAIVQWVLREAYMETNQDLAFYAEKVKFYNAVKKAVRDELTEARKALANNAGKADKDALVDGAYPAKGINADFTGTDVPVEASTGAYQGEPVTTKADLDAYIKGLEEKLNTVGDDAQLANVDLQNMLQKQQQTLQMMSNISKMLNDTAMAIIRKIGG